MRTLELPLELWAEVHDVVQKGFALLESTVRCQMGELQATAGRTQGSAFLLFSYRTFSAPNSTVDPVVVGLTFTRVDDKVAIEGDVSGEQTGDLIFTIPMKTVPPSRGELMGASRELA